MVELTVVAVTPGPCLPEPTDLRLCLFRHVGAVEHQSIEASGAFSVPEGYTGKYFFVRPEQARRLADLFERTPSGGPEPPHGLAIGRIHVDAIRDEWWCCPSGEGVALFVPEDALPEITTVSVHET